jgi:hypothetical protein
MVLLRDTSEQSFHARTSPKTKIIIDVVVLNNYNRRCRGVLVLFWISTLHMYITLHDFGNYRNCPH